MNNLGLVEYVKKCLNLGNNSTYIMGTFGNILTNNLIIIKQRQYGYCNTPTRSDKLRKLCDNLHYAFDCVGLIKSYYWGGFGNIIYDPKSDLGANAMYEKASVKGNISSMDKSKVGLLVQMDGHIGVYIGNDEVIECTISPVFAKQNHGLGGVCKTKLSDRKWLHWLECPFIKYESTVTNVINTSSNFFGNKGYFSFGDNNENIGRIATFMYNTFPAYTKKEVLGNYYGNNIKSSITEFQKRTGLQADGCIGPITLNKLVEFGFKY